MLSPTIILAPFYAVLLGIEIGYDRYRGLGIYGLWDTFNNLSAGLIGTLLGYIFGLFTIPFFLLLYDIAPFKFSPEIWWSWGILFLLDDLTDYWIHRLCHERRLLWNFHAVHHSSENFNLSVALRQTWFGNILHWVTYAPLALLGFPLWMYLVVHGLNLAYQAWIHTRFIGRLGWLEYVFNTPSHHRAHHGSNDIYLDKNYGGVLIIWDRIFGTFVSETEEPRYGLIKPLISTNTFWINLHSWSEMFIAIKNRRSLHEKFRCIFGSPDML